MLATNQVPDDNKLKELVLYVSEKCEGDDAFGAVKLNKILFYADFIAYVRLGRSITGHEYQALQQGPAPRRLLPIRDQLAKEGRLIVAPRDYHGQKQTKPIALTSPDLNEFTAEEIAIVDSVIEELWGRNASEVSKLSHLFLGWKLAQENETIPYEVALVSFREPTLAQRKKAIELEASAKSCIQ